MKDCLFLTQANFVAAVKKTLVQVNPIVNQRYPTNKWIKREHFFTSTEHWVGHSPHQDTAMHITLFWHPVRFFATMVILYTMESIRLLINAIRTIEHEHFFTYTVTLGRVFSSPRQEVSVTVTYRLTRVWICRQRATTMPFILLEVLVKVTHRLARVSACSQRATSMPLILLEVSVKVESGYAAKGLPPCHLSCYKCQWKLHIHIFCSWSIQLYICWCNCSTRQSISMSVTADHPVKGNVWRKSKLHWGVRN